MGSKSKKSRVRTQFGRKKSNPNKNLKKFLKRKEAQELASGPCENVLENNHQELAQNVISSNNSFSSNFLQPASTETALISTSSAFIASTSSGSSSASSTSTGSTPILTASKSTTPTSIDSTTNENFEIFNAETINLDNEIQNVNPNTTFKLKGTRRIINLEYFIAQVKKYNFHGNALDCNFSDAELKNEHKNGLNSKLYYQCKMCQFKFFIYTDRPIHYEKPKQIKQYGNKKVLCMRSDENLPNENLQNENLLDENLPNENSPTENDHNCDNPDCRRDINYEAVLGTANIGAGFYNLQEFLHNLEIPCMSNDLFKKKQQKLSQHYLSAAQKSMIDAVFEETNLALEHGDFKEGETPLLTVIVDGCWSKRSYRTNYSALSGFASIIGFYSKKVLWYGVRNKYCVTCARTKNKNVSVSDEPYFDHVCNCNYVGPSSGMEASILVEGFKLSLSLYGVIYKSFIGDGDSNVLKKLTDPEDRIYPNVDIEKIECKNHLLRNLDRKLRDVVSGKTKNKYSPINNLNFQLKFRKILGSRLSQIRKDIRTAVKHWKTASLPETTKISNLKSDLNNIPYHVFGSHVNCASYFECTYHGEDNYLESTKDDGIFHELSSYLINLSIDAKSLIKDLDSNPAEQLNSLVAKYVGGKRINYSLGDSYAMRCSMAVVQYNTSMSSYYLKQHIFKNNMDNSLIKQTLVQRKKKCDNNCKKVKTSCKKKQEKTDENYGRFSERPNLDPQNYAIQRKKILDILEKNKLQRDYIELNTRDQASDGSWAEIRRLMLTSSNFYEACVGSIENGTKKAKRIVENKSLNTRAINHGKYYEDIARKQLESQLKKTDSNIKITECGLFIDSEFDFLGSSPDGMVNDKEGIIEIKCPYNSFNKEIETSIKDMKFFNRVGLLRKSHKYFYQIQGQLHITDRKFCYFAVWTSDKWDLKVEKIQRDDQFWNNKMIPKLIWFYNEKMLPLLIDRQSRL
jgi:hypothetical protein